MPTGYTVPAGLPVDLGGRQYQIDKAQLRRRFLPAQRQSVDSTPTPGASSFNPEGGIPRSQSDWSLGAGQEYFDDDDSDPRRFNRHENVQAVRRGRITLPNRLTQRSSVRGQGQFVFVPWQERSVVQTGNSLIWFEFASPNYNIYQASIASGAYVSPTVNLRIGPSANATLCLATDGTNTTWCARGGSGVSRATTEAGAWTAAWSAVGTNVIAYCNGHLLGISGAGVWEFDAAGAKLGGANIFDHPNTSWIWQGAVAGSGLIYLWGGSANESAVYVISDVLTGGTLAPPKIALPMPPGEAVFHMEPIGGVFVARTNLGIRILEPNGDILESGPLIVHRRTPEAYAEIPTAISAGSGDTVMVSWRSLFGQPDDISRLDLTRFAGEVPAHHHVEYRAPDATAANNAIGCIKVVGRADLGFSSGQLWVFGGTSTNSVRRMWACNILQAPNSDNTARERVPTGSFYSGWITYGASEEKVPLELLMTFDPLPAGATLQAALVDEAGSEFGIISGGATGDTSMTADLTASIGFAPPRRFQLKFTLLRSTDTLDAPAFDSWRVRCRFIAPRIEEILLPIQLFGTVQGENDQEIGQSAYDEFVFLKGLVTGGLKALLTEGSLAQYVFVDDILLADGTSAMGMQANAFHEGVYTVRCLGAL